MASQNNLNAVFTDIANAIRDKKGSVDTIKPINMADEILTISSGISVKDFITTRNAQNLFYECSSLTNEQLASILKYDDTSGATSMHYMFSGCSKLTSIPQLNTSNVSDMSNMFSGCSKLTSIPQLNTSNVSNMSNMFVYCISLTSIPQLNTSNVSNMSNMFNNCKLLTSIPQLNTSSCTNMSYMFTNCQVLEKIDITMLVSGTSYNNQFANSCYSLKTLIIRTMDTIPALNSNAFKNCYHFYGTTNATYNPNGLKDGRIYVPDDKVESLKTATNWSVFADIIKPLSEYTGE